MNPELPVVDDTVVWNAWLSLYKVPAITVALELDIFEALLAEPGSPESLAKRMGFSLRGLVALLPMLMVQGFLEQRGGFYQLTEAGRHYMIKSSPFYWGGLFNRISPTLTPHKMLLETVSNKRKDSGVTRPADGWESGHVDMELAISVTEFMHNHSFAAAIGMTKTYDFSGLTHLLDVGGGSGCFAIALANHLPELHCTVMELSTICELAEGYIKEAGVSSQVNTRVVDMFRQDWPTEYDGHFFSNIFHDWSLETCADLAAASFKALPSGGKILLHEMLLDDSGTGPVHTLSFSLLMALGTMGQQFTYVQLDGMLSNAGFINVRSQHTYGYYSIVSGEKP